MAGEKLIQKALQAAKAAHAKRYIADPLERDINLGKFLQGTKTVNDEGDLFKLYHITKGDFSEFTPGGPGARSSQPSGPAIWLSANPNYLPATHNVGYPGEYAAGANVMPLWASMKNPLVVEKGFSEQKYGSGFPFAISPEGREKLIADGYDSVINRITQSGQEEYLALHPEQLKSATGNAGTFDPTSPRIEENRGGEVDAALHAVRHHLAGGGFLSDLFSGPDYLSTGEVASPTNWGDPERASDFFKADRALRLAQQASEPARDVPLPPRRPAPEAAPRQQIAAAPPAPAPDQAFTPIRVEDLAVPAQPQFRLNAEPIIGPYDFGQAVSGQQVTTQMLPHFQERPGFGQVLLNNKTNWADVQPEVPTSSPQRYTMPPAALAPPAPQAEINNAVTLARETIPSAADALAAVENLHNAGVYSGEALDKAGEILGAHLRARDAGIPVEEALRLTRAEGPRMINQGMPTEERPAVQPLAYTAAPVPAPAQAAISTVAIPAAEKLTARAPQDAEPTVTNARILAAIRANESRNNPRAQNPTSSAGGLYQFLNSTWGNTLRRMDPERFGAYNDRQLRGLKTDPNAVDIQHAAANYHLTNDIAPRLSKAGVPLTPGSAYLSWFQGPGGAVRAYTAPDDATVAQVFPKTVSANANMRFNGKPYAQWTMSDLRQWADTAMAKRMGRAEGGLVDDALHVVREHHADGEAVGPVSTDNSERVRAAESAANLAKQIQAYEASMASIRQQPKWQEMSHAPEKPRAPISVEMLGKNREFGSAPYDVAGPLSTLAQGAYDLKTAPLYAFPPTAPLGMAIDTAEGVASGSPTQVAMGALGGPLKVARNVIAPLAVATGVTAPDEAEAKSLSKVLQAIRAYQDPVAHKIADWNWRPLSDVHQELGLTKLPPHVQAFGDYMKEMSDKAGREGLSARDLLKGYTTTRASIQRRATDADNLRRLGLNLDSDVEKIRPEGAWMEWLGTPMGQKFLDEAAKGNISEDTVANAVKIMAPFGRHETDIPDAMRWAAKNIPGREVAASDLVHRAAQGASTPEEWRSFTSDIRGVGPSKSGFLASLYGRGDQPTLDARQIILNTGEPTKLAAPFIARSGGQGGVEAVNRLAARQAALGLKAPSKYDPFYQHLAHHAIWDKASNEMTTHGDIIKGMRNYAEGGSVEDRALMLVSKQA
jgi:hypothetical protein